MNREKEYKEFLKAVHKTQFIIETKGDEDVNIKVKGYEAGVVFKMTYVMCELLKMGTIDMESFEEMVRLVKETVEDNPKLFKHLKKPKKEVQVKAVAVSEEDAKKLEEFLSQLSNKSVEFDLNDLDIPDFLKGKK